jgi:hypothetical protein
VADLEAALKSKSETEQNYREEKTQITIRDATAFSGLP